MSPASSVIVQGISLARGAGLANRDRRAAAAGRLSDDDVVVSREGGPGILVTRGNFAGTVDLRQRRGTVTLADCDEFAIDSFVRILYSLALVEARGWSCTPRA